MKTTLNQNALLACALVGFLVSGNAEAQLPPDSVMIGITSEFNRHTPLRYDAHTMVDSMIWDSQSKTISYRYTLLHSRESFSAQDERAQHAKIVNGNCTHPDLLRLINNGMKIKHSYVDLHGRNTFQFSVDRSVCLRLARGQL